MRCPVCGAEIDDDELPDGLDEHADRQAWLDAEEVALLREAKRGEQ